jgi:hypothetical protein
VSMANSILDLVFVQSLPDDRAEISVLSRGRRGKPSAHHSITEIVRFNIAVWSTI